MVFLASKQKQILEESDHVSGTETKIFSKNKVSVLDKVRKGSLTITQAEHKL